MNPQTQIKDLAIQYFEGKLPFQNETVLYNFIDESDENQLLFHTWEKEWADTLQATENTDTIQAWEKLSRQISFKNTFVHTKKPRNLFQLFAISAAAVLLLLIGVSFFVRQYTLNHLPETYTTVQTPKGEKSKVILADGSVAWINSDSKLTYPNNPSSKFIVKLVGEGYFEVAKRKERKFIVETPFYNIEVRGTKFNVKAYQDGDFATTTLIEGKIDLHHKNGSVQVTPGEEIKYNVKTGEITKSTVDPLNASTWTLNRILYENIPLQELVIKLSQKYQVNIVLENPEFRLKPITISLRNEESVKEVMRAIEKIMPVKVENNGDDYYIKEK